MDVVAVVPAAGRGERLGPGPPKPYREVGGIAILARTVEMLARARAIDGIVLVVSGEEIARAEGIVPEGAPVFQVVAGGKERFDSVRIGLGEVPEEAEIVVVHDGVRPFVTVREVEETVAMARDVGAAVAVTAPVETVKRIEEGRLHATLDRDRIRLAQTPQAFRTGVLRRAYEAAMEEGFVGTDEASLVERIGGEIGLVEADRWNVKITSEEDLRLAEWILREVRK